MLNKVLGNLEKGKIFVVSAPAGTGKTTLVKTLTDEFPCVKAAISLTTRAPRVNEKNGVDYLFVSREEFQKKIDEGDFLEYVELYGEFYGTSKKSLEKLQSEGNHVVLVIDTEGGQKIKQLMQAILIFIMPPSIEELAERLKNRNTENPEIIEKRLNWAKHEIEDAKYYDYKIINKDLKIAYEVLRSIFIAEEHKIDLFQN